MTSDALTLFGQSAWFNIAAARRELGYAPRVGMSEGLRARVGVSRARAHAREVMFLLAASQMRMLVRESDLALPTPASGRGEQRLHRLESERMSTSPDNATPRRPNPLLAVLGRALEAALDRVIDLDPETRAALRALDGRAITVEFRNTPLAMRIAVVGDRLAIGPAFEGESALRVAATPSALLGLALARGREGAVTPGSVDIAGDADLARRIERIASRFAPDFDEAFARVFGDVAGHQIARGVRARSRALRDSAQGVRARHRGISHRRKPRRRRRSPSSMRSSTTSTRARARRPHRSARAPPRRVARETCRVTPLRQIPRLLRHRAPCWCATGSTISSTPRISIAR